MRGGQRGGNWLQNGLNKFVHWNVGWMKRTLDKSARLRAQQQQQQRGGRIPTLHERHCRRVLHGSKKKKKKSGVTARKRKKRSRRRRGIM